MMNNGLIFWFTGLSGSGKTTIASGAAERLRQQGKKVCIIDGDVVREKLTRHLTFSPSDIVENNRIIAELCRQERARNHYVFVPVISPFEEGRCAAKEIIGAGVYIIYVKATLEDVIRRDVKGLYKKALNGEIENFIGLSDKVPFQEPKDPDLELDTARETEETTVVRLLEFIRRIESE